MKMIGGFIFLIASVSASSYLSPWSILPPTDDWKAILRSLISPYEIPSYVGIYVQPFREFQAAERNTGVSPAVIKSSILALLDLSIQTFNRFNVTEDAFARRDKAAFETSLKTALEPFDSPNADQIKPVFGRSTMGQFFYQRLDDMLVAARTYSDLQKRCRGFAKYLRTVQLQLKRWNPNEFNYIVPRNLDLREIEAYSTAVLQDHYSNATLTEHDINGMKNKLYSLGNKATSLVVSVGTLLVTMFSAILALV